MEKLGRWGVGARACECDGWRNRRRQTHILEDDVTESRGQGRPQQRKMLFTIAGLSLLAFACGCWGLARLGAHVGFSGRRYRFLSELQGKWMHEHELLPVVPILSSNNSDHWRHPLLRGRSIAQLLCASVHAIYTAPSQFCPKSNYFKFIYK